MYQDTSDMSNRMPRMVYETGVPWSIRAPNPYGLAASAAGAASATAAVSTFSICSLDYKTIIRTGRLITLTHKQIAGRDRRCRQNQKPLVELENYRRVWRSPRRPAHQMSLV